MYPVSLDLSRIRITLVGKGEAYTRRLKQLEAAGATQLTLFENILPHAHEIKQANILMIAGLDDQTSAVLASIARLQGVIVNVEDKPDLCDFHFVSFVKRGDLTLAVSTNGASPTLGQEIRSYLADIFGEEWSIIVDIIGKKRLEWKREGLDNKTISDRTRTYLKEQGLLSSGSGVASLIPARRSKSYSPILAISDAVSEAAVL